MYFTLRHSRVPDKGAGTAGQNLEGRVRAAEVFTQPWPCLELWRGLGRPTRPARHKWGESSLGRLINAMENCRPQAALDLGELKSRLHLYGV